MAFVHFIKHDILVTDVISLEYTSNMNSCIFQTAFHERGKNHMVEPCLNVPCQTINTRITAMLLVCDGS